MRWSHRFARAFSLLLAACASGPSTSKPPEYARTGQELLPYAQQNFAYRWLNVMQEAAARDVDRFGARPPVLSRQMLLWAMAMYDAWAAYDEVALPSCANAPTRRPSVERTLANKNLAISHASYRALLGAFPAQADFLRAEMQRLGCDPANASLDPSSPIGIGNLAAASVLAARDHDGSNHDGREPGSDGTPYSDYTGYQPINPVDRIVDPDRWQPITFTRPDGSTFTPGFLVPHWFKVRPFLLESAEQFRAPPPPTTKTDDALLHEQTDIVLAMNQHLTSEQKAVVEFMRDGPRSTGQSGHWLRFAQDVSRRDRHTLDQDVKLYFAIAGVAFDAFLSCWETKRHYDTSRPWTLVRHYYRGQRVSGWAGTGGGVVEMAAEAWHPYSPQVFITPPFPGYTSGHATVSGACAKVLELFTGSDVYGAKEMRRCCLLTEDDAGGEATLDLPTFSATAEMAAVSRALGGYHIPIDNDVGLRIGRDIANWSWPKYRSLFDGGR
jgi:hypothetical protein